LQYTSPLTRIEYNTVEGYAVEGALNLRYRAKVDSVSRFTKIPLGEWNLGGTGRYQFGRKGFAGYGLGSYQYKTTRVAVQGGRYVFQFNPDNPISPALNTLTTLLFEQNFMKLYQKDFLNLTITTSPFQQRLALTGSLEYAQRSELANFNEAITPWINWRNRTYTGQPPRQQRGCQHRLPNPRCAYSEPDGFGPIRRNAIRYSKRSADSQARQRQSLLTLNYRKGMREVDYDFCRRPLPTPLKRAFVAG
jgi:hypothetical protein